MYLHTAGVLLFMTGSTASGQSQASPTPGDKTVFIFDGKTFSGWEGDTVNTWRIENGALTAGSLSITVPHNDFLVTTKSYSNFDLRLKFKLTGSEGFINAGVQFRSKQLKDPPYEMTGYQADLGPHYWASLYDESRRNRTLAAPDSLLLTKILVAGTWNDYEVNCANNRIRIYLNGVITVDYLEKDKSIPPEGFIGLQIHGGGKTIVAYKEIRIEEK